MRYMKRTVVQAKVERSAISVTTTPESPASSCPESGKKTQKMDLTELRKLLEKMDEQP